MQINVIINGSFDVDEGDPGFGWEGNDIEAENTESTYQGNNSDDRVAEMDGEANQITVMQQTFSIDKTATGTLSFDAAIRNIEAARAGSDGFTVTVTDSSNTVIFTQGIYPETHAFEAFSFDVIFPEAGDYTLTLTESYQDTVPNDSYGALVDDIALMVCLTKGTLIATPAGDVLIEDLRAGDWVSTMTGPQQLRWIGARTINAHDLTQNEKLRPIRIAAGALARNVPRQDMLISRQHRMLVSSPIAQRMFATTEVLISAIKLTEWPGIAIDTNCKEVTYFHLLFDRHEVIVANGAPTESLYSGPEALKALPAEARDEILTLFPQLADDDGFVPKPARFIPVGKRQRELVARHLKNGKPLVC